MCNWAFLGSSNWVDIIVKQSTDWDNQWVGWQQLPFLFCQENFTINSCLRATTTGSQHFKYKNNRTVCYPGICAWLHFISPIYVVFSTLCLQLLMDSQMSRGSFKKWPLTLQPMKWLRTWQSGTKRYVGAKHILLGRQWVLLISLSTILPVNRKLISVWHLDGSLSF